MLNKLHLAMQAKTEELRQENEQHRWVTANKRTTEKVQKETTEKIQNIVHNNNNINNNNINNNNNNNNNISSPNGGTVTRLSPQANPAPSIKPSTLPNDPSSGDMSLSKSPTVSKPKLPEEMTVNELKIELQKAPLDIRLIQMLCRKSRHWKNVEHLLVNTKAYALKHNRLFKAAILMELLGDHWRQMPSMLAKHIAANLYSQSAKAYHKLNQKHDNKFLGNFNHCTIKHNDSIESRNKFPPGLVEILCNNSADNWTGAYRALTQAKTQHNRLIDSAILGELLGDHWRLIPTWLGWTLAANSYSQSAEAFGKIVEETGDDHYLKNFQISIAKCDETLEGRQKFPFSYGSIRATCKNLFLSREEVRSMLVEAGTYVFQHNQIVESAVLWDILGDYWRLEPSWIAWNIAAESYTRSAIVFHEVNKATGQCEAYFNMADNKLTKTLLGRDNFPCPAEYADKPEIPTYLNQI